MAIAGYLYILKAYADSMLLDCKLTATFDSLVGFVGVSLYFKWIADS